MEARLEPGNQFQRDAVHQEDEQCHRHDGQRQRDDEEDWPDDGVHDAQQQRRHDERARSGDGDSGEQHIGDPQSEGGDDEPDKESPHGAEDNLPATKRAVIPGRACTPILASMRMDPERESRPAGARETPANGPRSTGQPLTMACSGWPNHVTAMVSGFGARKVMRPRNRHSRPTTIVAGSSKMSPDPKRSLMAAASGKVKVSPRAPRP